MRYYRILLPAQTEAFCNVQKVSVTPGSKTRYYRFLLPAQTEAFCNVQKVSVTPGSKMRYYRFLLPAQIEAFCNVQKSLSRQVVKCGTTAFCYRHRQRLFATYK